MDNNVKSNTNFWTEINKNNIHVPYYQRDYAQGRCDGGRIDNIREVFVEELYQTITDPKKEKTCHLGLVFGSYDVAKNSFIAVDGQQRLTTVFLLHWYVAWHEGKLSDYEKTLKNFSWDTRGFSSQFVTLLFKIASGDNVSDAITTNKDYFSIWENDPTVKGMLIMLKEIETQYPKTEDGLCAKLFSNDCNIRYDILRLEKNSDGKTYLKMNSRGRSLTTFELFKSKFIDNYKPSFAAKFDTSWLDFMLAISNNENVDFADPDISYMNFINEYTYLILKSKDITDSDTYKEFIAAKLKGNQIDVPFISFEKYHSAFAGNIDCFSNFFDWIIDNYEKIKGIDKELGFKSEKKEWEFFLDKIIKSHNPTFYHRAKFISLFKYANLTKYDLVNEELYRKWNRVFRNLIENSDINASNFGDVCETVYKINNSDIYLYLYSGGELSSFNKEQVKEEKDKAKQILNENGNLRRYDDKYSWEDRIKEAESFAFFKGVIRFLFQDEKGEVDIDPETGIWNTRHFDKKWTTVQKYFDERGVKDEYKVSLTKSLVIQCVNWDEQLYDKQIFNPNASTWKWILCSSIWKAPIHHILFEDELSKISYTDSLSNDEANKYITPVLLSLPYEEFIYKEPTGRFRWKNGRLGYYKPWGHDAILFDWGDFQRNEILNEIIGHIDISNQKNNNKPYFFWGWNIDFNYLKDGNTYSFQWSYNNFVYLLEKNGDKKIKDESKTDNKEKLYCFNAVGVKDIIKQLDILIDTIGIVV